MLAFDATYLTSTCCQMTMGGQTGLVGGVWSPFEEKSGFVPLDGDIDLKKINRARAMMEVLVWDPSSRKKLPLSVCSVPIQHDFGGAGASGRAGFYILHAIGRIMQCSRGLVRGICFDAHGSHQRVRKVLQGNLHSIDEQDLEAVPYFGKLTFEDVDSGLPRFPCRIAKYEGQTIFCLGGICALSHPSW